jgi:hypothetical protein
MSDSSPPNRLFRRLFRSRTIPMVVVCVAAVVFTSVFFLADRLLEAQPPPGGLVESPQLGGLDARNPADQAFTYRGYTNFPGSQGRVEIYVLKQGNGNATPTNDSLWTLVRTVIPSNNVTVVGGEARYAWSTVRGVVNLFHTPGLLSSLGLEGRWPQGGTARVRFKAVRGTASADLPVRDRNGVLGLDLVLVLSDFDPNPAQPVFGTTPNYLSKKSIQFPLPKPFGSKPKGWTQEQETKSYYQNAFVDRAQTISVFDGIPTLKHFQVRYFGPIVPDPARPNCVRLSTPETVATYFNKGDLGLGREMHCIDNSCTQEIACYVKNYGAVKFLRNSGPPFFADIFQPVIKFDDRAAALEALNHGEHFATVAMVERQWMGGVGSSRPPNKVLFLVFEPENPASVFVSENVLSIGPVRLDNKGFNTFNPGNCLVCHGTSSSYDLATSTVSGAYFLPFDLQAFEYFSSDPASPLSRAHQEDNFKALNRIVYFTDLFFLDAPHTLIGTWYNSFTRSTFLDNAVPDGWNANDNSRQLYKKVVAKACRTCHISAEGTVSLSPALAFGSFTEFQAFKGFSVPDMCGPTKLMPQAEQTIKVLWKSDARSHFLNRSSVRSTGCGYVVTAPAPHEVP